MKHILFPLENWNCKVNLVNWISQITFDDDIILKKGGGINEPVGHLVIAAGFVDLGKNYVLMETLYVALLLYLPSTQPPAHSVLKMEK